MIKNVIDLLAIGEHYKISKNVDFAKGSHKIPYNWKQLKNLLKRLWHGR
jgi:hypothetical protein